MKKILLTYGMILIIVFSLFSFLDRSEYSLEKRLWFAHRDYEVMAQDPKAVPDESFTALIKRYRDIINDFPESKLIPKVYIKIGSIHALRKDHPQARASYQEALEKYRENPSVAAGALINIGRSYEQEDNIPEAIKAYQRVMKEYPLTDHGLNAPLYVANYLFRAQKVTDAKKALHDAVVFYKKVIAGQPEATLDFYARRMLAATYFAQKDWKSGINTLGDILLLFSKSAQLNGQNFAFIVKSMNTIAVANLQDYDLPMKIYRKFIEQNPDHPMNGFLQKTIDGLQELKDKNIGIKFVSPDQIGQP